MSKRNWRPFALPTIGVFALGVVGWGIYEHPSCSDVFTSLQNEKSEADKAAYEGSVICERDCQVTFGPLHNAKDEADNATEEQSVTCNTAEKLDLVQQMVMAHWAIVSALLAMLGLFGVLFTFRETHKMGQIQTRAYLSCDSGTYILDDRGIPTLKITIDIRNTGNSPARNIAISALWKIYHLQDGEYVRIMNRRVPDLEVVQIGGQQSQPREFTVPGFNEGSFTHWLEQNGMIVVIGKLKWDDVFDVSHETAFAVAAVLEAAEEKVVRIWSGLMIPSNPDSWDKTEQ